ncbi:MAG: PHB depolymerase family esterase [Fuerstiella sp.]
MNCKASILFVLLLITGTVADGQVGRRSGPVTGERVTITHGDQLRNYRIHVPDSGLGRGPVPLVLVLHGGGGNSAQASAMGMTAVADTHGFIVVYPNAVSSHWNDGRISDRFAAQDTQADDVAFLSAVVESVSEDHNIDIDPRRVFITGLSNGGFMSQRMAMERSDLFAAAAVVIATMSEPLSRKFQPEYPVSMLFMNGTADPLVPYQGGEVVVDLFPQLSQLLRKPPPGRGRCIATGDAVLLWLQRNGLKPQDGHSVMLPDRDPTDGSRIEFTLWSGGESGTAVALYRVDGGGHTIPGGAQYLPARIIGSVNRDIDGMTTIWKFFEEHGRK